jgi:hemolysin III
VSRHNRSSQRDDLQETISIMDEIKPLLRGWLHLIAAIGAIIVTIGLVRHTYDDPPRFISMLIFGVSMILLYTVSSVYHLGNWQGRKDTALRVFDHANIFLLIAGTYTPICVNVLTGQLRIITLSLVWSIATLGVMSTVLAFRLPRVIATMRYLGLGWIGVIALPSLARTLPMTALMIFFLGGVLYTIGALVYMLRRPDPVPHVFGYHEVFHVFVVAGSAAFVAVIWIWVVPFQAV